MEKIESSTRSTGSFTTKAQQNAWLFETIVYCTKWIYTTFLSVIITISLIWRNFDKSWDFIQLGGTDFACSVAVKSQQNAWLFETIRKYTVYCTKWIYTPSRTSNVFKFLIFFVSSKGNSWRLTLLLLMNLLHLTLFRIVA